MRKVTLAAALVAVSGSVATAQSEVFAVDVRAAPNRVLKFPVSTPANTAINTNLTPDIFALDFNGDGSVLYCITFAAGNNQLGTIDTTTGAFTAIALIGGAGAAELNWGDLSWDPTTNTMYCMSPAGAGLNNLYTINLTTAETTLVGAVSGAATALFIDLAIDNQGNMFGHDIATDALFSINKTTAAATVIGPTGVNANFAQGMDFDPATNILYATIYVGTGVGQFSSINTTTGAATLILLTTPWNSEMEMAIRAGGAPVTCYANCDNTTIPPCLNVNDFTCFLNSFGAGSNYANCDASTIAPVLNVNDFTCFLNTFGAGCGANNCSPHP